MDQTKKKKQRHTLPPEVLAEIWQAQTQGIPTDVLGSYKGTGLKSEQPVQDADDLSCGPIQ